ncbi:hypothetical protein [Ottowia sp.]|uniref:hypothetical protein n=1 Tax=Ottowia sp. TaxID=1898956 RepID=UPI0025D00280|nr:hypothetical protein [Ottowia sp.]MBK6616575.1 hypothetical protein [Ottowia sp.]
MATHLERAQKRAAAAPSQQRVSVRLAPFKALLDAGFPAAHVRKQVERHLLALERLPAGTEGKEDAIQETKAYLGNIETDEEPGQAATS